MAKVRIFLLTYRRPALLSRALDSLQNQTYTDWVCELHNDAPDDDGPRRLVETTGDPRIVLHHHEHNWGAVATFNHAYACAGAESLGSILEDDNWWEPDFLATAVKAIHAEPAANVVWTNMRIWAEQPDRSWRDTGRTIWTRAPTAPPSRLFYFPEPLQLADALHSQGAMVYRAAASRRALVPAETPLAIIEPVRERLLPGGWLLLTEPLANFAVTRQTARGSDRAAWAQAQLLVAGSYLKNLAASPAAIVRHWHHLRGQTPPGTNLLCQLALAGLPPRSLLRGSKPRDWLRFVAGAIRRPTVLVETLRFRRRYVTLWPLLCEAARERVKEASAHNTQRDLFEKHLSN